MDMTPTDRLIVALDVPNPIAINLVMDLRRIGVRAYKLSASNFMDETSVGSLVRSIVNPWPGHDDLKSSLMLDLKVWDTPDSVRRIVGAALATGARWVTVKAEDDVVAAAQFAAREYPEAMVLPIGNLTSNPESANMAGEYLMTSSGAVLPVCDLKRFRRRFPNALFFTPGIRLFDSNVESAANDHDPEYGLATPSEAVKLGADHVIVGRPITLAPDPVAAARAYLEDLDKAS
jgi:orotidine-5'-phosphate decarboxylase